MIEPAILYLAILATLLATPWGALKAIGIAAIMLAVMIAACALLVNVAAAGRRKAGR